MKYVVASGVAKVGVTIKLRLTDAQFAPRKDMVDKDGRDHMPIEVLYFKEGEVLDIKTPEKDLPGSLKQHLVKYTKRAAAGDSGGGDADPGNGGGADNGNGDGNGDNGGDNGDNGGDDD